MHYPCSENKGTDQLRGYREADLCLCFRIIMLIVGFLMRQLITGVMSKKKTGFPIIHLISFHMKY